MSWNYRIAHTTEEGEEIFTLRECYYEPDGAVRAYTVEAIAPFAETLDDLRWVVEKMLLAFDRPVIEDKSC